MMRTPESGLAYSVRGGKGFAVFHPTFGGVGWMTLYPSTIGCHEW